MKKSMCILGAAAVAGAALLPSQAMALSDHLVGGFTLNFEDAVKADGGDPVALGVTNITTTAPLPLINGLNGSLSFVAFHDAGAWGTPDEVISAGDTFDDWGVMSLQSINGVSLESLIGDGPDLDLINEYGKTLEATVVFHMRGVQNADPSIAGGSLSITEIVDMTLYIDAVDTAGNNFTASDNTDFSTFADGIAVERASSLISPSGGTVTDFGAGLLTSTINVNVVVDDLLADMNPAYKPFEHNLRDITGDLFSSYLDLAEWNLTHRTVARNTFMPFGVVQPFEDFDTPGRGFDIASIGAPILSAFDPAHPLADLGFYKDIVTDLGDTFEFGFVASSNTDIIKGLTPAIPEPVTATLSAMGLGALGLVSRRRRIA